MAARRGGGRVARGYLCRRVGLRGEPISFLSFLGEGENRGWGGTRRSSGRPAGPWCCISLYGAG